MQVNKRPLRVALLGIYHESNTFLTTPTTMEDFENGHFLIGEQIRQEYVGSHHEIGGMLEVLDDEHFEVIPVLFAEATPGGVICADTCERLIANMMTQLEKVLPVDACLVVPHGAAVSEEFADLDGHWLSLIRKQLGPIPIVGTLDPHANVSTQMIEATDALIAYGTNPHIDQKETGKKAAALLVQMLKDNLKPVQQLIQAPIAISIEQQNTSVEPCQSLYKYAASLTEKHALLSLSVILGFPYADVAEMGTSFILIDQDGSEAGPEAGEGLLQYMRHNKFSFIGNKQDIIAQLKAIEAKPKPVLLLDMGDNVGGGSAGDSTFLLEKLEALHPYKVFICIYDPEAVLRSRQYKIHQTFDLSFGQSYGNEYSTQYQSSVTLLNTAEGKFKEELPRHGGQTSYDMGQIAIVSTKKDNVVMLMSKKIAPFSLSQLTSFGIKPEDFDVIIAKGVNAPIAAYGPVCPTIIQINTPGTTQADMTLSKYNNRRYPLFPFETAI